MSGILKLSPNFVVIDIERKEDDAEVISTQGGFSVVTAHPDLIKYVDSLQRKNAEALSFYPKCVFERESEKGRIYLGILNGEPCGYIYVGAKREDVKCHQVCIEYGARRNMYGAGLVSAMEDYAISGGAYTITLRCGFDLEANKFWKTMGYSCVGVVDGGIRRMRKINIWRKQLKDELILDRIVTPAVGVTDASVWRKQKRVGIINQFARGKKMAGYRALLISSVNAPAKKEKPDNEGGQI